MNNWKPLKALSFLFVPLVLVFLSSPAFCQEPSTQTIASPSEVSGHSHKHDAHQTLVKQLGLSPEQSQKVKAIMQGGHQQSQTLKAQLRAKRHALMAYVQTPNASQSQP